MTSKQPRVALVHDFINQWGGAERVLYALHELYPQAPIFTLFYDPDLFKSQVGQNQADSLFGLDQASLQTTAMQKLPAWLRNNRLLLPVYPTAIEMLDLSDYDLIISDSSAFSKGVITRPDAVHICYCHTPTRYLWDWHERYLQEQRLGWFKRTLLVPFLSLLRVWDFWAADRVDQFIANSENVRNRIRKYYDRESQVIYPPIDVQANRSLVSTTKADRKIKDYYDGLEKDDDYYLVVARLSGYKKVDLAIEACNRLQLPLVVVGTGREESRLKEMAWSSVRFAGQVSDAQLVEHYQKCKALIMPGEEDFGMVMVEAMSWGKPVIAYKQGGALEIVQAGINGEFFAQPKVRSLMDCLRDFEKKWQAGAYQMIEIFDSIQKI